MSISRWLCRVGLSFSTSEGASALWLSVKLRPLRIGLHVNDLLPPLFHAPADLYSVVGIDLVF